MSNKWYRLWIGIGSILVLFFLIWGGRQTHILSVLRELSGETMVTTAMPAYTFMQNMENIQEPGLAKSFVHSIYPVSEYMFANENTAEIGMKQPEIKDDMEMGASGIDGLQSKENPSVPLPEPAQKQNIPPDVITSPEVQQAEHEMSDQQTDVPVISRKVVTGQVFDRKQLNDYSFLIQKFYTITSITDLTTDILRPEEFLNKNLAIQKDAQKPQILIFHTHSQEMFADSIEGDMSTSIVGVGDYLTKLLTEKYGYNVIHDRSVYDYVDGKLDRSKAYTYAEKGIEKILKENESIAVVIDLHRDGVADTTHLTTEIDGKKMAKIMFFNGLSYSRIKGNIDYLYNPYRDDNLAMSLQMHLLGSAYYPDFLRRIYVNAYRYCLHERGRSMLIEAGAQTNTFEEVRNAMEPLADLLDKCLSGEKAY